MRPRACSPLEKPQKSGSLATSTIEACIVISSADLEGPARMMSIPAIEGILTSKIYICQRRAAGARIYQKVGQISILDFLR
jgi:hypothetical protein